MNCPLCGNKKSFKFIESSYSHELAIEYKIFKCKNCELEFSIPMKSAPPSHYERYEWYGERWEFFETLKFLKGKKLKIMDIGCGEGYFLNLAKKMGFEVVGIDFNKKAIEIAKEKFGIERVYPFTIEEFIEKFPDEKFDVICAFHLIEHLENPLDFIFKFKKILNKQGFFIFSIPSDRRISVKLKRREEFDYPPHHLTRWNDKSIKFLAGKTGFEIIKIKDEDCSLNSILNHLMQTIHFNLTKKFCKKENSFTKNFKCDELNGSINKIIKIKKFLFLPLAFILYFPIKFLKIKEQDKLVIAKKKDYKING